MNSSLTRLPAISTKLKIRPRKTEPPANTETTNEAEVAKKLEIEAFGRLKSKIAEFRAQRNAEELLDLEYQLPDFLYATLDPYAAFTTQFDLNQCFSDKILTFVNPDAHDKKKSLRRITTVSEAQESAENLSPEAIARILGEVKRIMKHSFECTDMFLSFFYRVTRVKRHLLGYLSGVVSKLSVDRTVSTHPRLLSLRLFDTSYLIELGQMTARSVCLIQSMQMRQRRIAGEARFNALLDAAKTQLSLLPFSAEAFRTAMPTGWQLHPDTNTPLTEKEIEQQNDRIRGDFTFLCVGLLVALGFNQSAENTIVSLLYESSL